jgi:hypothetical protein
MSAVDRHLHHEAIPLAAMWEYRASGNRATARIGESLK